jgi:hypothetical protein
MKRFLQNCLLGFGLAVALPGARADEPRTNPQAVAGIWVLQQVGSIEELDRLEPVISDALENFDTVGFCLRYPWRAADADFALLERGREIARRHGRAFSIRFMAGRHTPARIFDAGCPYYVVPGYGGRGGPDKVPVPMLPDGSPNTVFEEHYRAYVRRLADWCGRNDVRLIHLAWYGQDWAELNNGLEVRAVPGYTYDRWFDAHTRLIDIGLEVAGPKLAVEFPFSGHGPSGDTCSQFADHVWDRTGGGAPQFFFQGNGWGPEQVWGSPNREMEQMKNLAFARPVNRGLQMIQPQDYDWKATFAHLYEKRATYGEVYVPSFALAGRVALQQEIARFAAHCREQGGPVAPRGALKKPALAMRQPRPAAAEGPLLRWPVASVEDLGRQDRETKSPAGSRLVVEVPWTAVDDRYALLNAAAQLARERSWGLIVMLRTGASTPARVFSAGAVGETREGAMVPLPFDAQGKPNRVFEREYEKAVAHLASWCRLNAVGTLVLPGYAPDWADPEGTTKLRALPGYSDEAWRAAAGRLEALGKRQDGRTLRIVERLP